MKSQEHRRSVLILTDEPTGKFDTRTSVEIMELPRKLNDKGRTLPVKPVEELGNN